MTVEDFEQIIKDIFSGITNLRHLPLNLYLFTSNRILKGVYQGYGSGLEELIQKGADATLLTNLSRNVYNFSAAKTFSQVYELQGALFKDGFKVSFADFKKEADKVLEEYNKRWLETEYNTAIISAAAASQWEEIESQKELFPLLQYETVGDSNVRPEHAAIDGVVKRVDDIFWTRFYPPNDWNCRCTVVQLSADEGEPTKFEPGQLREIYKDVPPMFRNNPAKSNVIFQSDHPYFQVDERYQMLKDNNFNLPMPI